MATTKKFFLLGEGMHEAIIDLELWEGVRARAVTRTVSSVIWSKEETDRYA